MMSWINRRLYKLLRPAYEKAIEDLLKEVGWISYNDPRHNRHTKPRKLHVLDRIILKKQIRNRLDTEDYSPLPFPDESKPSLWFWSI